MGIGCVRWLGFEIGRRPISFYYIGGQPSKATFNGYTESKTRNIYLVGPGFCDRVIVVGLPTKFRKTIGDLVS